MKKIFLLSLSVLTLTLGLIAQKSNMTFFAKNGEQFYLIINGVQQNKEPMANVKLTELSAPVRYAVRIKFADEKLGIIDDKVNLEEATDKVWSIQRKNNATYVIRLLDMQSITETTVEHSNGPQVVVYHSTNTANSSIGSVDGVNLAFNANENGANFNLNMNGANGNSVASSNTTTTTTTYTEQSGGAGFQNCASPLNQITFRSELEKVRNQTTASGKKILAQKVAANNCLTSKQIFELCSALQMSNDKLDLAKYCYGKCFDPDNYFEVYNAFSISNQVNELDNYIKSFVHTEAPVIIRHPPVREEEEVYVQGYDGPRGCRRPMNTSSFADAKQTIKDDSFENTKISTAKTIISSNCITTNQVIEICKLFDYENTKLEFAKFAYAHTYDKGNYFKVAVVFDFDASKTELNRFISKGGNK